MNKLLLVGIAVIVVLIAGGVVALGLWDMPPPSKTVEKVIPNDRFDN